MALRNLLHHCARPLGLARDPWLTLRRPMPTNPLALIGYLPTFRVPILHHLSNDCRMQQTSFDGGDASSYRLTVPFTPGRRRRTYPTVNPPARQWRRLNRKSPPVCIG